MLIKELPQKISDKTFVNVKEFMVFVYQEQIVTEFGELTEDEVTESMKVSLKNAQKVNKTNFINI